MRITIDTHAATPAEMGICIATLIASGAEPVQGCELATRQDIGGMAGVKGFTDAEIIARVDALNAELYSRRIPAADNPATGADAAALNSDAHGELAQTGGGAIEKYIMGQIANRDTTDLSSIFGGGGGQTETVDLRVDKQTADAVNANPQGAIDALAKGAEQMLGVVLDKAGIPWDSRIHSASKSINQTDGLWRQKRGVSPEVVATVVGQLKQAQSVPAVGTIVVDNSITGDGDGQGDVNYKSHTLYTDADKDRPDVICDTNGSVVLDLCKVCRRGESELHDEPCAPRATKIPPPPPVAAAPSAPPPPPTDTGEIDSLPRLLKFITEQKLAGKINQAQVQAALTALGIEGPLPVLQSRPDLIPEMVKKLRAIGGL